MGRTREDITIMARESVLTAVNALKLCIKEPKDQEAIADLASQVFYIKTVSNNADVLTNDAVKISYNSLSEICEVKSEKAVAGLAKQLLYHLYEAEK